MNSNAIDVSAEPREVKLRDITIDQWHAFVGVFLAWVLDGFDFSILTFLLIEIEHTFTVDKALAGALGTVTLVLRLIGGVGAGTAADRFGRKAPLMLSILWFSCFSLLSGISTTYAMLFAARALFGIGMGGVWAAGMPLALEHWPKNLRGLASGLLQGGFNWGFVLAAVIFQLLSPVVTQHTWGWRIVFFVGALPALLVFWILSRVQESPVWLVRQETTTNHKVRQLSLVTIFQKKLIPVTLQTCLLMTACMFSYYSITFWYPTFLRESSLSLLAYMLALHFGAILGTASWGRISEGRLGRRGAVTFASLIGVLTVPIFVGSHTHSVLLIGAFVMGVCGIGIWGMAPSYLTERFPTLARGVGPGFAYHTGAAIGSITPIVIGTLQDHGLPLPRAMQWCMLVSGLLVSTMVWLGPETRGRSFTLRE